MAVEANIDRQAEQTATEAESLSEFKFTRRKWTDDGFSLETLTVVWSSPTWTWVEWTRENGKVHSQIESRAFFGQASGRIAHYQTLATVGNFRRLGF